MRGDHGLPRVDRHCILPSGRKGRPLRIARSKDRSWGGKRNKVGGVGLHVPASLPVLDQAQRIRGYGRSSHGCRCDRT